MSEKYKVYDSKIPTFITITTVGWVDVFTRNNYAEIIDKSLAYCIKEKGLIVMAYVYMTNHIHLIVKSEENKLQENIRDFKKFTSKEIIKEIESTNESRKVWMLNKFGYEANRTKRGVKYKFWKDLKFTHFIGYSLVKHKILDEPLYTSKSSNVRLCR